MTRLGHAGPEWLGPFVRTLVVPLWAAGTAAVGSYVGVVRKLDDVAAEVRVLQAGHAAAMASIERRLARVENEMPRDAATRQDLATVRNDAEHAAATWVERHERAYHHQRERSVR